jgi:DNA polymerase-3 subunit delta'
VAGLRTLGQPAAVAAVRALLGSRFPHAVVVTGPAGVGKSTLALDIAAALLCSAEDSVERPCGDCRACRMVGHSNHPDVHRLGPSGAGGGISIGGRGERGVRDLVSDLALLPVEGGARVAIIEAAHRMSEDAQSALLKTLEEPPAGTTILLCADDEERLLPTIRSRCTRIRLGPLGIRDVEAVLAARGVADAPTAARLARITDGRPGHAIAFALAPAAATIRGEIARNLLDLLGAGLTTRLSGIRELAGRAAELGRELDAGAERASTVDAGDAPAVRGRGSRAAAGSRGVRRPAANVEVAAEPAADGSEVPPGAPAARVPAAERRRAALLLVGIWRSVLRDLALAGRGATASIRDVDLLDDLAMVAPTLHPDRAGELLRDLELAGERLEGNVSPELVLDVLAVRWVASARAA